MKSAGITSVHLRVCVCVCSGFPAPPSITGPPAERDHDPGKEEGRERREEQGGGDASWVGRHLEKDDDVPGIAWKERRGLGRGVGGVVGGGSK